MSWIVEFKRRGEENFRPNSIRLALKHEAEEYAKFLFPRMIISAEFRIVESTDRATHYFHHGKLTQLVREKRKAPEPEPPKPNRRQVLEEQLQQLQQALNQATGFHIRKRVEEGIAQIRKQIAEAVLSGE